MPNKWRNQRARRRKGESSVSRTNANTPIEKTLKYLAGSNEIFAQIQEKMSRSPKFARKVTLLTRRFIITNKNKKLLQTELENARSLERKPEIGRKLAEAMKIDNHSFMSLVRFLQNAGIITKGWTPEGGNWAKED